MPDNFVLKQELTIPDTVFKKLTTLEQRINAIKNSSDKMANHFVNAVTKMNGADLKNLISKVEALRAAMSGIGSSSNTDKNLLNTAKNAEKAANGIVNMADALDKVSTENKNIAELTELIKKLNKELTQKGGIPLAGGMQQSVVDLRNQYKQMLKSQQQTIPSYEGAMSLADSATSISKRTEAIKQLKLAREQLSTTDANYKTKLDALNSAIVRMNKLNNEAVGKTDELRRRQSSLLNTSDQLMRKLALVFSVSQISGYIRNLVQVRGEFELQNRALAAILQNKDQADKLFGQIQQLAVKSPFTVKELTTYSKQLAAYQFQYEELYDTTKRLADVSAGLGVDMGRLALAIGQVKAANYLRGTETRQFTEAGLNILGELAKYYSELEGRIVSVSEVQERQFKRMIAYEDVAEVFRRITDEGGMFYNMQEQLAESLAGQMSNLRDSLDIMMNEIGKDWEGGIKGVISIVRSLVNNWQIFASLIEGAGVAFVVYAAKAIFAANKTKIFSLSQAEATTQLKGFQLALYKTGNAFKSLVAFAKANVFTLVVGAIASTAIYLKQMSDKVEENRAKYDVLTRSLDENRRTLNNLTKSLSENQKSIQSIKKDIDSLQEGTSQFNEKQAELNRLQTEHDNILNQLKVKYPEIYQKMSGGKGTVEELKEAQKEYNEELERTLTLNYILKDDEGWFSSGINTNLTNLTESTAKYNTEIEKAKTGLNALKLKIEEVAASNPEIANSNFYKQFFQIYNSTEDIFTKFDKIQKSFVTADDKSLLATLFGDWGEIRDELNKAKPAGDIIKQQKEDSIAAQADIVKAIKVTLQQAGVSTIDEFKKLDEQSQKTSYDVLRNMFSSLDAIKDKIAVDFINKEFRLKFGIDLILPEGQKPLEGIQAKVAEFIKNKGFSFGSADMIKQTQSLDQYISHLISRYNELSKERDALLKATEDRQTTENNKTRLAEVERQMSEFKTTIEAYGGSVEKTSKASAKSTDKELEKFKKRVDLLKKANSEYEKLRQQYSAEDANAIVLDKFKEALLGTKLSEGFVTSMEFDLSGVTESIKKLAENAKPSIEQAAKEELAPMETEIRLNIRDDSMEQIKNEIDSLFSGYEMSLEFKEAGFDKDAFKGLLTSAGATEADMELMGLPTMDVDKYYDEIRKKIKELREMGGKENLEEAKRQEQKLTEMILREATDRMKEYADLRKKYESPEAQIKRIEGEIAGYQAELDKLGKDSQSKEAELYRLRIKDGENTIFQLKTEALQLTEFWKKLFGDLEDYSTKTLFGLRETAQDVLGNAKEIYVDGKLSGYSSWYIDSNSIKREVKLTEQQYQQLIKASKNAFNEIKEKNPFAALYELLKRGKAEGDSNIDYIIELQNVSTAAISAAKGLADSLATVFGADDEAQEMLNNVFSLTQGVTDLGMGIARIAEGDYIGGITSTLAGLASVVSSITNIKDSKLNREIEEQQEKVERLQKAYEKLEEAINDALNPASAKYSYEAAQRNLDQQIASYERMLAAEKEKKKQDEDAQREYQDAIEELERQKEELRAETIQSYGGFGDIDSMKSAAREFADAWLEAYRETGDGLDALNDKWDEYIDNLIANKLMMAGFDKFLKPIMDFVDSSLNDFEFSPDEAAKMQEMIDKTMPELNEFWKTIMGQFGNIGAGSAELSGLSKGIQSITEETAQALEALLNSIRGMVSDANRRLASINALLLNPPTESPYLSEMRLQTEQLRTLNSLMSSMSKMDGSNGRVMKVKMM